jgi:hypothetical protein
MYSYYGHFFPSILGTAWATESGERKRKKWKRGRTVERRRWNFGRVVLKKKKKFKNKTAVNICKTSE